MTDMEKVIKGLECCTKGDEAEPCHDEGCPYADIPDDCMGDVMRDALELLKNTQYCKPTIKTAHAQGADDIWYECSKCGGFLSVNWNGVKVCKKCGRPVKWDG